MNIVSKVETRVLFVVAVIVTLIGTIIGMKIVAIKPMQKIYEGQISKQNELILEMAKIEKYKIENTYTIKKVKKGSTVVLAPENEMNIQQVTQGLDEKITELSQFNDSIKNTPRKSFWEKLKFW